MWKEVENFVAKERRYGHVKIEEVKFIREVLWSELLANRYRGRPK